MTVTPTQTPIVNTVIVSQANPNGWAFIQEATTGVGGYVTGPGTPPLGVGSAQLQVNSTGIESLASGLYAGTRLDQLTQLVYHTYTQSSTPPEAIMLQLDMDYNLNDANTAPQGRLIYDPTLNGTVTPGAWQMWNAFSGKWYATAAPGLGPCPPSSPCTLSTLLAYYPNAGIRVGSTTSGDPAGQLLFEVGGWGQPFAGYVDALTIGVNSTASTLLTRLSKRILRLDNLTITTYDFEPNAPTAVSVRSFSATAAGGDVTLRWETASEADVLGFRLSRSAAADGPYTSVGPDLIPGEMSLSGASYAYTDAGASSGWWYYRLQTISTSGAVIETLGPVGVVVR